MSQRFPLVIQRGQAQVACSCCTCAIIGRGTSPHSLRLSTPIDILAVLAKGPSRCRPVTPNWIYCGQVRYPDSADSRSIRRVRAGNNIEMFVRSPGRFRAATESPCDIIGQSGPAFRRGPPLASTNPLRHKQAFPAFCRARLTSWSLSSHLPYPTHISSSCSKERATHELSS